MKALDRKVWEMATAETAAMFPKDYHGDPLVSPDTFAQLIRFHYTRHMANRQENETA